MSVEITLAQFNKIAIGDYNAGFVDFKTDDQGNDKAFLQAVEHQVRHQGRADSGVILNEEEPTNVNAPKAAGESPDLCSCM